MSLIQVDSTHIGNVSTSIQRSANTIAGEVQAMKTHLDALGGTWKGSAATSFQALATDWQLTQKRVHSSLEQIRAALATAGQQYSDVESANAARFKQG